MEGYKISNKQQLMEAIEKGGLHAEFIDNPEDDPGKDGYIDIYNLVDEVIGHFEPGNGEWELVCYSAENEAILKKFGILDLTKYYWPWY